ncbi:hypothetical protein [Cellulosimicrobium protaetiae]
MTSPTAVARMIEQRRPPLPRIGIVTAIAASTVTVTFSDGTTTPQLQYATAYVPAVGDQVLVIPTTTAWVVQGKVSAAPSLVPDETARTPAVNAWQKARSVNLPGIPAGTWYYQYDNAVGGYRTYPQGRAPEPAGGPGHVPRLIDWASVLYHGPLASLVPSGSTITGVSLVYQRVPSGADLPALVPPVLYGHTYTPGAPPSTAVAPAWTPGFGPLAYPPVAMGESTRITLPSSWVIAWLAGTITGIGFWSERADQAAPYWEAPAAGDLEITYTPPA